MNTNMVNSSSASIDRLSISVDRLDDPASVRAAVEHAVAQALVGQGHTGIDRAARRSIASAVASEIATRVARDATRSSTTSMPP